jgi:hypothetical protein
MDYSLILKRAFEITKKYRVLWFFGLFVGAGSWGGNFNFRMPGSRESHWKGSEKFFKGMEHGFRPFSHWLTAETLVVVGLLILAALLVFAVLRYVSLTALPRAVDRIENSTEEERLSFSDVWKLGWSRRAWTLLGIEIVTFFVVLAILVLVGGLLIGLPLYFLLHNGGGNTLGVLLKMLLPGLLALAIIFVTIVVTTLVTRFAWFHAAVDGTGVFDSFGWSIRAFRMELGHILMMWLIMIGVGIVLAIILLLGVILFALVTLLIAGGIGWMIWKTVAELPAIIVAVLIGTVTFILPLLALSGAMGAYKTTAWVLMYREVKQNLLSTEVVGVAGGE